MVAGPTCSREFWHGLSGELVARDPGIVVHLFACILSHNGDFTPIHAQGLGPGLDGHLPYPAILPQFVIASIPMSNRHGLNGILHPGQKLDASYGALGT